MFRLRKIAIKKITGYAILIGQNCPRKSNEYSDSYKNKNVVTVIQL